MKTKRKLRTWVKVALLMIASLIVYLNTGRLGELAQNNKFAEFGCYVVWLWLFIGQFVVAYFITENDDRK